jgi:hypothetical protein
MEEEEADTQTTDKVENTRRSSSVLETLIAPQLFYKFSAFYETLRFITLLTRASQMKSNPHPPFLFPF